MAVGEAGLTALPFSCGFRAAPHVSGSSYQTKVPMPDRFRAVLIDHAHHRQQAEFCRLPRSDLMLGNLTVAVSHGAVNYEDGLALTGRARVAAKDTVAGKSGGVLSSTGHPDVRQGAERQR